MTVVKSEIQFRQARAKTHLLESAETQRQAAEDCLPSILTAADLLVEIFRNGGKVLLCGNGGSAADCQHMAAEFVSRLTRDFERPGLPAIALTTDTSFMTAFANDSGFEGLFERQVRTLGKPGDLLIGISTSGNSANVRLAIGAARELGLKTIALMGAEGEMEKEVDCAIRVPSRQTQYIQETLLSIEHILCDLTEQILFREGE